MLANSIPLSRQTSDQNQHRNVQGGIEAPNDKLPLFSAVEVTNARPAGTDAQKDSELEIVMHEIVQACSNAIESKNNLDFAACKNILIKVAKEWSQPDKYRKKKRALVIDIKYRQLFSDIEPKIKTLIKATNKQIKYEERYVNENIVRLINKLTEREVAAKSSTPADNPTKDNLTQQASKSPRFFEKIDQAGGSIGGENLCINAQKHNELVEVEAVIQETVEMYQAAIRYKNLDYILFRERFIAVVNTLAKFGKFSKETRELFGTKKCQDLFVKIKPQILYLLEATDKQVEYEGQHIKKYIVRLLHELTDLEENLQLSAKPNSDAKLDGNELTQNVNTHPKTTANIAKSLIEFINHFYKSYKPNPGAKFVFPYDSVKLQLINYLRTYIAFSSAIKVEEINSEEYCNQFTLRELPDLRQSNLQLAPGLYFENVVNQQNIPERMYYFVKKPGGDKPLYLNLSNNGKLELDKVNAGQVVMPITVKRYIDNNVGLDSLFAKGIYKLTVSSKIKYYLFGPNIALKFCPTIQGRAKINQSLGKNLFLNELKKRCSSLPDLFSVAKDNLFNRFGIYNNPTLEESYKKLINYFKAKFIEWQQINLIDFSKLTIDELDEILELLNDAKFKSNIDKVVETCKYVVKEKKQLNFMTFKKILISQAKIWTDLAINIKPTTYPEGYAAHKEIFEQFNYALQSLIWAAKTETKEYQGELMNANIVRLLETLDQIEGIGDIQ